MNFYLKIYTFAATGLAFASGQIQQSTDQKNSVESVKTAFIPEQDANLMEITSKKSPPVEVAPPTERLPSADKVPGNPGYVFSPFIADHRIVDVTHMKSGTKVKCPYTMRIFCVP